MKPRIACIGGTTIDRQVRPIETLRLATSNPVKSTFGHGGAVRNAAEALARLGCGVSLFSRVGRDGAGSEALAALGALGVDVSGVDRSDVRPTASYTAVFDENGELSIGLADMAIFDELEPTWVDHVAPRLPGYRLSIVDANLPANVLEKLLSSDVARRPILANPVSVEKSKRLGPFLDRVDVIFPDRAEAEALTGIATDSVDGAAAAAAELRHRGTGTVVVTLGSDGLWVESGERSEHLPPLPVTRIVNVNGAGDALLAGYAWALVSAGLDPLESGLAAASLALESGWTVPRELNHETLLTRTREAASR